MHTTNPSLLVQLRCPTASASWAQFVHTYSPLLYTWARKFGLQSADAADLVQDVFARLVQRLPGFRYDGRQRFRGWLWTVTRNCCRDRFRRAALPIDPGAEPGAIPAAPEGSPALDRAEYERYLAAVIVPAARAQVHPSTWAIFWQHAVEGRPVGEVAEEFGVSLASVYKAKVRVLSRIHRELGDTVGP